LSAKTVVGDDRALLLEAFRDAVNRVPLTIASGGLGPTEDDLTRETVAELLGRKLIRKRSNRFAPLKLASVPSAARCRTPICVKRWFQKAASHWIIRAEPLPAYGLKIATG